MQSGRLNMRKRMKFALMFSVILFIIILGKIASLQIINGKELKEEAYVQRNFGRSINPKRGTIYDRTGEKILAVSATVETVSIVPVNISKDNKEKVARIISEIFELDYEKVLKKVNKRTSIEIIKRRTIPMIDTVFFIQLSSPVKFKFVRLSEPIDDCLCAFFENGIGIFSDGFVQQLEFR